MDAAQMQGCKVVTTIFIFYFVGMWLSALWLGFISHDTKADSKEAWMICFWPLSIIFWICMSVADWKEDMELKESRIYMVVKVFLFGLSIPFRPRYIGWKIGRCVDKWKGRRGHSNEA